MGLFGVSPAALICAADQVEELALWKGAVPARARFGDKKVRWRGPPATRDVGQGIVISSEGEQHPITFRTGPGV